MPEQISNNTIAKFMTVEWLSLMGGLLVMAAVSGMGYSNLLSADQANITAVKANTAKLEEKTKSTKIVIETQKGFSLEIQGIQLRLQAIEINQENSKRQNDRIETLINELVRRGAG
jgi:Tfp pilus assembly protein PilO